MFANCYSHYYSQLSIKARSNKWLPKTLLSVQLQPNISYNCSAMVAYSPANHSPQYKYVLSKFIQKLYVALSWEQLNCLFFLS